MGSATCSKYALEGRNFYFQLRLLDSEVMTEII